jgi:hypothetical protein
MSGLEFRETTGRGRLRARRNILRIVFGARGSLARESDCFLLSPAHLVKQRADMQKGRVLQGNRFRPPRLIDASTRNVNAACLENSGHLADRPGAGSACCGRHKVAGRQHCGLHQSRPGLDTIARAKSCGRRELSGQPLLCRSSRFGAGWPARLPCLCRHRHSGDRPGAGRPAATARTLPAPGTDLGACNLMCPRCEPGSKGDYNVLPSEADKHSQRRRGPARPQ